MVVHHAINLLASQDFSVRYVHFVTGAFPFLAGFAITHFSPLGAGNAPKKARGGKFIFRGARLLLICLLLNVAAELFAGHNAKAADSTLGDLIAAILWAGDFRSVSFSLLVPIGYVLMLAGVATLAKALTPRLVLGAAALGSLYGLVGEAIGSSNFYATYIAIGLAGLALGFASPALISRIGQAFLLAPACYLMVVMLILLCGQPFPIYLVNVVVSLWLLWSLANQLSGGAWWSRMLALLGRYTLIGYLAQIIFLKLLSFWMGQIGAPLLRFGAASMATLCFLVLLGLILDRCRRSHLLVERAYRTCFA
jgi:hypothetical protein